MNGVSYENSLEKANADVLSEKFPKTADFFEKIKTKYESFATSDGFQVKDTQGRLLTRQPEPEYSRQRVENFLGVPPRLAMVSKSYGADTLKEVWDEAVKESDLDPDDPVWRTFPSIDQSEGLIIFDVGSLDAMAGLLKDHLPNLKTVFCIIRDFDYFFSQIKYEDWTQFLAYLDEREIAFELHFIKELSDILKHLRVHIWKDHLLYPDNILVYFHFAGPEQKNLWSSIRYEYKSLISGLGFFDDEIEMYLHTAANLVDREAFCLNKTKDSTFGRAIIVGSGPSLDESIIQMRDVFEHSFVIAAGTAVEPLLAAGIRVDVCVVLERTKNLADIYEEMGQRVNLSDVDLVASSTVAPGLGKSFRRSVYFFRPGLNVLPGFGAEDSNTLFGCDPTVSNTGLALALALNFEQCLLVGVDMGTTDVEIHHARQSAYHTGDVKFTQPFTLPAVAQFGGQAYTSGVLHWARQALESLIKTHRFRAQIINASNGVQIDSVPALSAELAADVDRYFPISRNLLPNFDDFVTCFDEANVTYSYDSLDELIKGLYEILETFNWKDKYALGVALHSLLWRSGNTKALPMIIRGSLYLLIYHAFSVLGRTEESELEQAETTFREGLLRVVAVMDQRIREVLSTLTPITESKT